jgi:hypothetical protein
MSKNDSSQYGQIFFLPYDNSITLKSDGSVIYSFHEEGMPYNTEEDISGSTLGRLLMQFSARGPKELFLGGDSLGRDSGQSSLGPPNVRTYVSMNEVNEMNERKNVRKEQSSTTRFTQETEQTLLTSGIQLDHVRYLASFSSIRQILETSSNPVNAARTILDRDKHKAALPAWVRKNPAPPVELPDFEDQGADSAADQFLGNIPEDLQDIVGPDGKLVNVCKSCGDPDIPPCCKQCPHYDAAKDPAVAMRAYQIEEN